MYLTEWTLKTLFGKMIQSTCPLTSSTKVFISEGSPSSNNLSFVIDPVSLSEEGNGWAVYELTGVYGESGVWGVASLCVGSG